MYNSLLHKQIEKYFGDLANVPPEMIQFLSTISESYDHFENDRSSIKQSMELELKESKLDQEQGELDAKAEFLSTVSHEILTPLHAVVGISNILLMDVKDPSTIDNLNTLKFSADTLLSLVNNILDFSKVESGQIAFEKIDFDLREMIQNIRSTFLAKSSSLGIELIIAVCDKLPALITGDANRISQILLNLIGNSLKFTHEGHIKIRVCTLDRQDGRVQLRFSVEDTGIGISKDKQELIFKNFAQADADTTIKYGGTGLGLPITKKILELMGSKINVQSKIGEGSRFFFLLDFETPTISDEPIVKKIENAHFANQKILLVDDNHINVTIAKRILIKWGLHVDTAFNGKVAYEKVLTEDYELILMDLNMPVMDGYESAIMIRALDDSKKSQIPIIALTAAAEDSSKVRIKECEMNDFMSKPFEPKALNKLLQSYLFGYENNSPRRASCQI